MPVFSASHHGIAMAMESLLSAHAITDINHLHVTMINWYHLITEKLMVGSETVGIPASDE
jgi:hypothetical protein